MVKVWAPTVATGSGREYMPFTRRKSMFLDIDTRQLVEKLLWWIGKEIIKIINTVLHTVSIIKYSGIAI